MKRPRLRKWAKWACTLAAGGLLAIAVASVWFDATVKRSVRCRDAYGSADARKSDTVIREGALIVTSFVLEMGDRRGTPVTEWNVSEHSPDWRWHFWRRASNPVTMTTQIPLWPPILLMVIPAALLWYADSRRFGPHSCAGCGYDRRGLVLGVKCPECGTVPALASK